MHCLLFTCNGKLKGNNIYLDRGKDKLSNDGKNISWLFGNLRIQGAPK